MLVRAMTRIRVLDRLYASDERLELWEFTRQLDQARLEIAARLDIGLTDLMALHVVYTQPRCTPGELARALDLTVSGTSGVLDRVESRRLVLRRPHPLDRRSAQLEVTPLGRHAVMWSTEQIVERVGELLRTTADPVSDPVSVEAHTAPGDADGQTTPPGSPRAERGATEMPSLGNRPRRTGNSS